MKLLNLYFLLSLSCYAGFEDFEFIKFKHSKNLRKSLENTNSLISIPERINSLILNKNDLTSRRNKEVQSQAQATNESALIQVITNKFNQRYQQIGQKEADNILKEQVLTNSILNFKGLSWKEKIGSVELSFERSLSPALFDDSWLAQNELIISINAQALLGKLSEAQILDMTAQEIGLFAGLEFKRQYKVTTVARSYKEALKSDFKNLFLPFLSFRPSELLKNIEESSLYKRVDYFSLRAAASVPLPLSSTLNASITGKVEGLYINTLSVEKIYDTNSVRVSLDNKKGISASLMARLQADFFKLLKVSLLAYELEYEYSETRALHLELSSSTREQIETSHELMSDFKSLFKFRGNIAQSLYPHVVSSEVRMSENLNSKFSALFYGNVKKRETEKVVLSNSDKSEVFYRHYSESTKAIKSIFSSIFSFLKKKYFDLESNIINNSALKKKMVFEFKQSQSKKYPLRAQVKSLDDLSLEFVMSYSARKTHRSHHRFYKKRAQKYLKLLTNLGDEFVHSLKSKKLRGPLKIENKISLSPIALKYFHNINEISAFKIFKKLCKSKSRKWNSIKKAHRALRRVQFGRNKCVKRLGKRFINYKEIIKKQKVYDIEKLKLFLAAYFKKVNSYKEFTMIFGKDSLFVSGSLTAKTSSNRSFKTFFKDGKYIKGGLIERAIANLK